jgi:hypothetical protein
MSDLQQPRHISTLPVPEPGPAGTGGSGCWGTPAASDGAADVVGGAESDPIR